MTFNKGDLLMLCGTVSWATYGILIKKYSKDSSPIKLMAYALVVCTLVVAPFAIREIVMYNPLSMPLENYYSIIYMAVFPTVVGYTIQQKAIRDLGPSTAALFINLVPIFSILLSVIILNEKVKPLTYVSGLIIIFAVYRYTNIRRKQAKVFNQ
jgi:drug/metabolite transporter (DMT)-like permease